MDNSKLNRSGPSSVDKANARLKSQSGCDRAYGGRVGDGDEVEAPDLEIAKGRRRSSVQGRKIDRAELVTVGHQLQRLTSRSRGLSGDASKLLENLEALAIGEVHVAVHVHSVQDGSGCAGGKDRGTVWILVVHDEETPGIDGIDCGGGTRGYGVTDLDGLHLDATAITRSIRGSFGEKVERVARRTGRVLSNGRVVGHHGGNN